MATSKSSGKPRQQGRGGSRPDASNAPGGGPRRLGGQSAPTAKKPTSAGAARRYDRSRGSSSKWIGWGAVAVVVIVVVALLAVKLGTKSSPAASNSAAALALSGRDPKPAPASLVAAITTIPSQVYASVGTDGQAAPFTVTKDQTPLTSGGKPRFVYVGGEFCPYCALMRWSLITALSRFGTFTGLKLMSSAPTDGDIPTYSFVGSTYKSPYVTFTPYESEDREEKPYQTPPKAVNLLYAKYDGSGTTAAAPFNPAASAGIPFLDIGNKYVSSGDPNAMALLFEQSGVLNDGGPGRTAIAAALRDPSSTVGKAISAKLFIAQANYIDAGICSLDGGKPATVCTSTGVVAAAKALAAVKPVS